MILQSVILEGDLNTITSVVHRPEVFKIYPNRDLAF